MAGAEIYDTITRTARDEDYGTASMRDEEWWFEQSGIEAVHRQQSEDVSLAASRSSSWRGKGASGRACPSLLPLLVWTLLVVVFATGWHV